MSRQASGGRNTLHVPVLRARAQSAPETAPLASGGQTSTSMNRSFPDLVALEASGAISVQTIPMHSPEPSRHASEHPPCRDGARARRKPPVRLYCHFG